MSDFLTVFCEPALPLSHKIPIVNHILGGLALTRRAQWGFIFMPTSTRDFQRPILVLMGLAVTLISHACSNLDAPERSLPHLAYSGRIVHTALSDRDIRLHGFAPVYRFKSEPGLVYVRAQQTSTEDEAQVFQAGLVPLWRSPLYRTLLTDALRKRPSSGVVKRALALTPDEIKPQSAFVEGGFDRALERVAQALGGALTPVRVAIIDSGVVATTPAIQNQLKWMTNLTLDSHPAGWQSHATAIASVFAGVERRERTEHAFAPNAQLHSIKISFSGENPDAMRKDLGILQLAAALDEAIAGGARIVNLSFSYRDALPDDVAQVERLLMSLGARKGVVFVAAAGNGNDNLDEKPIWPARYDLDNLVVVGAHDAKRRKAYSSNYGKSVDLTAQAVNVPLTGKDGTLEFFSGTSFAVPEVAAALSLYLGIVPEGTPETMLTDLCETAIAAYAPSSTVPISSARGLAREVHVSRCGRLNAEELILRALEYRENAMKAALPQQAH